MPENRTAKARALIDAAVNVAHIAAEIEEAATRHRDGAWLVEADDMQQLRAALGAWRRAGEDFLRALPVVVEGL